MIRILGIDHVVLRVRDLDRALAFYRDVLGCPLEREQASLGLWQLRAGSALIDLVPVDGPLGRAGGAAPARGRNVDHVCLALDDWDEARIRRHLASHGIQTEAARTRFGATGAGPSLYLTDPDGNTLELKGPPQEDAPRGATPPA